MDTLHECPTCGLFVVPGKQCDGDHVRDGFASDALVGIIRHGKKFSCREAEVRMAYMYADAMIKESRKQRGRTQQATL